MIPLSAAASSDGIIEMIVEEEPIPDSEEEVSQQEALVLARDGIAAAQAEREASMAQVAAMEIQLREMRAALVQLQLETSQSRSAQVPMSSEVQQPSPPVGPQLLTMSTSPLDRFKQWRASVTPMVCNIGSAIERAAAEGDTGASAVPKTRSTDKRDTTKA